MVRGLQDDEPALRCPFEDQPLLGFERRPAVDRRHDPLLRDHREPSPVMVFSCPKGGRLIAANATRAPQENTSAAGVKIPCRWRSGAIHPGEPTNPPVLVKAVPSRARAISKSTTFGPPAPRITFPGFRSRWTTPRERRSPNTARTPVARAVSCFPDRGPADPRPRPNEGPSTSSVANHGTSARVSAPRTRGPAVDAVGGESGVHGLDRDGRPVRVEGPLDHAHAARSKAVDQTVGPHVLGVVGVQGDRPGIRRPCAGVLTESGSRIGGLGQHPVGCASPRFGLRGAVPDQACSSVGRGADSAGALHHVVAQ